MFNRLFNLTITRVALLVGALMAISLVALPVYNLAFAQEDGSIEYAENGMDPVATFTAVDPEMTDIVSWTLAGTDAGVFDIDGGVLTFKKSPDYEMPGDLVGEDTSTAVADDNIYELTVQATDETNKVGMKEVVVEVTNVDEDGKVMLSALQPQSAIMFTATLSDPDNVTANTTDWQWAKASSMNGSYADIEDADGEDYEPVDADIGSYLRAMASYTDGEGSDKTAMMRSANAVQAVRGANEAPEFPDPDDPDTTDTETALVREVAENTAAGMPVGDPVMAEDDNGDIMTYTLTATDDASFDIDWATGQIMTKAALNFEADPAYTVTVRATDPSGIPQEQTAQTANSGEIEVTINVTDVNESPAVTGDAALTFDELADQITTQLNTYTAVDPESDTPIAWSVEGADAGKFAIDAGALSFEAKPDFENAGDANTDNVYEVTVVAADSNNNRGTMDVEVMVVNENEDGVVALSRTRPRVGVTVTASLTDPDGSISGLSWQWHNDTVDESNLADTVIEGADSDTYTPVAADATTGVTLRARAMYTDGEGAMKSAVGTAMNEVAADTRNKPPAFVDQDTETDGLQNDSTERMVEENTEAADPNDDAEATDDMADNVGRAVMAMDPDPNADPLIYTLTGTDADLFRVRDNGQIEVAAGTELDYEMKQTYMVTVMAEDSFGASAMIPVTIMVSDMDEKPKLTGDAMVDYAENMMGPVMTYRAVDPEETMIVSWMVDGDDKAHFDIQGGVLTFKKSPNYEDAVDTGTDNMYSVTVQATDSTMKMGEMEVTVTVTNVDESGMVTLSALQPQSAAPFTATLTDPDNSITGTKWQWAKASSGRNGSYTNITGETSMAYTPTDADSGSYLRATASYTDGEDSGKSARMESYNRVRRVPGSNEAPMFADDQDPVMDGEQAAAKREVAENTAAGQAIGDPVVAMDEDGGDILTYTLTSADTDADSFDINWATGQIMTKAELDFDVVADRTYTVTVRATDPSGIPQADPRVDANSDTVTVNIMVTDVNEPPAVTGAAEVTFQEGQGDIATSLDDYTADDPETSGANNDSDSNWSVSGADAGKFEISATGELTFEMKPDFENPGDANTDNVYEVTVVAADGDGNRGTMDVEVTVANENEDGVVTLSRTQPRVGVPVTASLTDPDGSISGLTWQWYNTAPTVATDPTPIELAQGAIEDATSETYTPLAADATGNVTLHARAMYTDGQGDMKSAVGVAAIEVALDTRNKPPAFEDQDMETDGTQNESAERMVEENTKALAGGDDDDAETTDDATADNVGGAVMAEDPDPNTDPLIYTLTGEDASLFRVRATGQIEVAAGTKLDYETKQTYMVTVMVEDSFGASAMIPVTIIVTDMDEAPEITAGGLAISGMSNVSRMEGSGTEVATYMASGPEADSTIWTLSGGDDMDDFNISRRGGVLTFRAAPDFDAPTDANMDNVYMVTVMANDGTYMDTHDVTVTVTEMDDGTVTPMPGTLLDRYDDNDNGMIDQAEVEEALADYFFDQTLSQEDVEEVLALYFFP